MHVIGDAVFLAERLLDAMKIQTGHVTVGLGVVLAGLKDCRTP